MTTRKWDYYVTQCPDLPPGARSPIMGSDSMRYWLERMDEKGWEFVSYGQTLWRDDTGTQQWWIFRKPYKKATKQKARA